MAKKNPPLPQTPPKKDAIFPNVDGPLVLGNVSGRKDTVKPPPPPAPPVAQNKQTDGKKSS